VDRRLIPVILLGQCLWRHQHNDLTQDVHEEMLLWRDNSTAVTQRLRRGHHGHHAWPPPASSPKESSCEADSSVSRAATAHRYRMYGDRYFPDLRSMARQGCQGARAVVACRKNNMKASHWSSCLERVCKRVVLGENSVHGG
jgi:hypothetical protein